MLESIRTAAQSWIAKLVLALISIPFALWGVESYIRTSPGQDSIATVGREKISSAEFSNAVKNQLDQFRAQFGKDIDASLMDNPEMRKSILDQLIDQRLLTTAVKSSNLRVTDAALRDRISGEASFQDNGAFSQARYSTFLQSQGMSATSFEALLRRDIERQQFIGSVAQTGFVATASAQQYLLAAEQSREIAIVNLPVDPLLAKVKITTEQAKAYYDSKSTEFTIPEQVRAEYVEFSIDTLAPTMKVAADDVKAYYDGNSARYVQKEERKSSHILIAAAKDAKDAEKAAAKAKADALLQQVKKAPQTFADVAKKNSQDPGSAANGGDLGFIGRGSGLAAEFEQAMFAGAKDEIVGPVLTEFGYHIIRITDIRPEKGKTLAEVTPEIEGQLKKQAAQKKFAELAEKFSNAAYEQSTSLKAAADIVGATIKQSQWISKGQGGLPPFNNPKLMTAIFNDNVLKDKRNTEAVEVAASSLVAARVLESKPSSLRPFAEVEQGITLRLQREEAAKLLKADGEAKLAALKEGKSDIKFPALLAVNRSNPGGLPPNVIDAAMKAGTSTLPAFVGVEAPTGYTLVQIAKVVEPALSDEAKLKATKQRVDQSFTQQQLLSTVAALRAKSDISIAKNALDKKTDQ
jgi:peptidyl-prolyl cis-trans isomerase D